MNKTQIIGKIRPTGFTLMEALVVLAISAILLAVAVPSFDATMARARASDGANTFLAAVELARSEAIRRSVNVTACRVLNISTTAPTCTDAASANYAKGDWAAGWVVYADNNLDGTHTTGEPVVAVQEAFPGDAAAPRAQVLAGSDVSTFTFRPDGTLAGGGLGLTVTYPQAARGAAKATKTMSVSVLGQVSIH